MSGPEANFPSAPINLVPSLQAVVESADLEPAKLVVGLKGIRKGQVELADRHTVIVSDGNKIGTWIAPSLAELFRGDQLPPADLEHYPPEYVPYFFFIESQFLALCQAIGDRTDQEMEEIYSNLRRRPDGRSLGISHDFIWQVLALLLGKHVLSAAEFEGLIGALLGSARRWGLRPVSRFYVGYLKNELD